MVSARHEITERPEGESAGSGISVRPTSDRLAARADEAVSAAESDHSGDEKDEETVKRPTERANFGLSGALVEDLSTGNVYNGVVLKWSEPADAAVPSRRWRLHVFKEGKQLDKALHIHRQSAILVGRERKVGLPTVLYQVVLTEPVQ